MNQRHSGSRRIFWSRQCGSFHPLMPFLTEEIWQQLPHGGGRSERSEKDSVTVSAWPEPTGGNPTAEATMATLMEVIESVRSIRGELNVPIGASVEVHIQSPNAEVRERLETYLAQYLPAFTKVADITIAAIAAKTACLGRSRYR